ncbi:hypothetical protein COU37_00755 [Candidatus Micrarchaeota archaeon CG10_big_fil_rev_8_21_14_0_10_45_29]|nr:MAG: hypothetical protein COU37_00755 [Candidatus Micrarchaeota archaeon CG10_big_fil_rev_8_21_14_0_10_45_29]
MKKIILLLAILFAGISFGEIWEEKCSDGTGYFQCSSLSPGYACLPDSAALSGLSLQKVLDQVNPDGHPKQGELTDLAVKCACANFEGYEEQNNKCVNPSDPSTFDEPAANASALNSSAPAAQNSTLTQNASDSGQAVNSAQGDGVILLNAPKEEEKKAEPPADGGILGMFGWVLVISVIGAGFVGVVLVIAGVSLFKLGRKGDGLGGV